MNKLMQNPERSLALVVTAHEKVIVTTYAIKHELYEFEITLRISRGKSFNTTTLRGIMHYNSQYNTTKIVASVLTKHTTFNVGMAITLFFAVTLLALLHLSEFAVILLLMMLMFPAGLWMMIGIIKYDTAHLLTMVEQVLLLADSRKSHRYGGYTNLDSPFYTDDVYQKSHDDSVYSR